MATVTLTDPAEWTVAAGPVSRLSIGGGGTAGSLNVWLRDKAGGARLVEIPATVFSSPEWEETRGRAPTAKVDIRRAAKNDADVWWVSLLQQWKRDIEIVWEGETVFWGPIADVPDAWGQEFASIPCEGAEWHFGQRVMKAADTFWSRNFVTNPEFDEGFSHWSNEGTLDTSEFETGTQSVRLDPGEKLRQRVLWDLPDASFSPRVRVRVKADATITSATLKFTRSDGIQSITATAMVGDLTPRGAWTWITVDTRFISSHLPIQSYLNVVDVTGTGNVWVDRAEAIINPASFRIKVPDALRPVNTPSVAVATIVDVVNSEQSVNIGLLTDPFTEGEPVQVPWADQPGMVCSIALRALSDREDGLEYRWLYSSTTRILEAKQLVGVEHDPEELTLRVQAGEGAGPRGNVSRGGGTGGVAKPTTRVIARSEDGFTDQAEDLSDWGMILEEQVQAPLGVTDLGSFANARLRSTNADTRSWTLALTDRTLISRLRLGDRVRMVIDDGPSQFDDLVRVESRKCTPHGPEPMTITVSRWVAPGPLIKVPRAAAPIVPPGMDGQVIDLSRRTYDLEQRLSQSGGAEVFPELLDVEARVLEHGDPVPGDVWGYNADGEWDIITPSGGGGGGPYASVSVTGLYDGTTVTGQVTEWQSHTTGYTIAVGSGGRGIDVDLQPTVAGVYQVSGSVEVTSGTGAPKVTVAMFGGSIDQWRIVGDVETCREPITAHDDGDLGGAVSLLMPLVSTDGIGVYIDIDVGSATEVRWRLQAHYVHPIAVSEGACDA